MASASCIDISLILCELSVQKTKEMNVVSKLKLN